MEASRVKNLNENGVPFFSKNPVLGFAIHPASPRSFLASDLSSSMKLLKAVDDTAVPLLMGYTWRWWPPLSKVKALIERGIVGKLRYVKFTMSAHLADWHPWERYQDFFMASRSLGGGALLDESHWLDLMLWFFGMPQKLFAKIERISGLEIETDDNVDMLVFYDNDLRVSLHLDLYGRPHEKSIQFAGDNGTLIWEPNQIKIGRGMDPDWEIEESDYDRNDMFVGVAREFLSLITGHPNQTCTIEDGVRVLNLIEAARISSSEEKVIELENAG